MPKRSRHSPILTPKEQRFVAEYIADENATQAAIRAGYSARTAHVQGPVLLGKPRVKAEVQRQLELIRAKNVDYKQRLIEETARLAFLDPRKLFDSAGNPLPLELIPADAAAAIAGLEVDNRLDKDSGIGYATRRIKLNNKNESLRLLADLLGLLKQKVEHSGAIAQYQLVDPYAQPPGKGDDE